jgi:hypothetical protein
LYTWRSCGRIPNGRRGRTLYKLFSHRGVALRQHLEVVEGSS